MDEDHSPWFLRARDLRHAAPTSQRSRERRCTVSSSHCNPTNTRCRKKRSAALSLSLATRLLDSHTGAAGTGRALARFRLAGHSALDENQASRRRRRDSCSPPATRKPRARRRSVAGLPWPGQYRQEEPSPGDRAGDCACVSRQSPGAGIDRRVFRRERTRRVETTQNAKAVVRCAVSTKCRARRARSHRRVFRSGPRSSVASLHSVQQNTDALERRRMSLSCDPAPSRRARPGHARGLAASCCSRFLSR
jgi:hypothetical protein